MKLTQHEQDILRKALEQACETIPKTVKGQRVLIPEINSLLEKLGSRVKVC